MDEDSVHGDSHLKTCVVLGGRGFIGRSLVSRLLRLGNWTVRVADSGHTLHLDESDSLLEDALSSGRASYHCVDVRDKPQIVKGFPLISCCTLLDMTLMDRFLVSRKCYGGVFGYLRFSGSDLSFGVTVLFLAVTEGSYVVFYMGATDLRSHDYFDCYKVIVQGKLLSHFKMVYHYIS